MLPEMKKTHRRTPTQKRDLNKAVLQLYKNLTHAQIRPRKFSAHPQNTPLQENTSGGLILHVKIILKVFYYEKKLFTVVKRNSFAIKMDNNNNNNNNNNNDNNNNNNKSNKYPVTVSRRPRNGLRFFHWALLL